MRDRRAHLRAWWVERVGFVLEAERELGVVVGRTSDGGRQAEVVSSLLRLTSRAEELAEAHVTVGDVGVVVEEVLAQPLGLVESLGVNQVNDAIGELVEWMTVVIDNGEPRVAGCADGWRRRVAVLLFASSGGSGLVIGQAALLVFLAAAAGTGLVASDLDHGSEMSLLKLFADATFYHVLERIDAELAEATRRARCP
jgi:hypothetical protein